MKMNASYILLENVRFFANHGVAPQETVVGNEFTVSMRLKIDVAHAAETDELENTVSYAEVHQILKEEMDVPSRLLEHVCRRMAERLFNEFPPIEEIEMRLSKRNPPMGADIDSAGVEIHCTRE